MEMNYWWVYVLFLHVFEAIYAAWKDSYLSRRKYFIIIFFIILDFTITLAACYDDSDFLFWVSLSLFIFGFLVVFFK